MSTLLHRYENEGEHPGDLLEEADKRIADLEGLVRELEDEATRFKKLSVLYYDNQTRCGQTVARYRLALVAIRDSGFTAGLCREYARRSLTDAEREPRSDISQWETNGGTV